MNEWTNQTVPALNCWTELEEWNTKYNSENFISEFWYTRRPSVKLG